MSSFVKKLAANDRPTRDAAVASLSQFLSAKKDLSKKDLLKLWKGLFYCFWMSDRPRTQQRLADDLASLVPKVRRENAMLFLDAFWETMCREWSGLDVLRMDKFYMLVRRYVAAAFKLLQAEKWNDRSVEEYIEILSKGPLHPKNQKMPNGLRYHITEIYLDELDKIVPAETYDAETGEELPIGALVKPFEALYTDSPTKLVRKRAEENVLRDGRLEKWGYVSTLGLDAKMDDAEEEEDSDNWLDDSDNDSDDGDDGEEWAGIQD
ncbi:hypothetical protein YB2330_001222 [Saitoella coloradoensis]